MRASAALQRELTRERFPIWNIQATVDRSASEPVTKEPRWERVPAQEQLTPLLCRLGDRSPATVVITTNRSDGGRNLRLTIARGFSTGAWILSMTVVLILGNLPTCAAADQETFNVNSPIQYLKSSTLGSTDKPETLDSTPLFASGMIEVANAHSFIAHFTSPPADPKFKDDRVTILHVLRWADDEHKTVKFQKWYVYDPNEKLNGSFYLSSAQSRFAGDAITGKTSFRLIYMHFNHVLGAPSESIGPDPTGVTTDLVLKTPISYKVATTKKQTQFAQDTQTLLQILTGSKVEAAENDYVLGYYSVFDFQSQYETSQITVSATLQGSNKPASDNTTGKSQKSSSTDANQLATHTYNNERPSWIGLSFAVPLTSYKDASYSQTANMVTPKTINRQNVYAAFDFYAPPVIPSLTSFRYLPHLLFGMPIKGQPLRNTMLGLGVGLRWLEPFAGLVFDYQEIPSSTATSTTNRLALKLVWGLNVSVSSVSKALTSKSSTTTSK
jgi:hypothetical protein